MYSTNIPWNWLSQYTNSYNMVPLPYSLILYPLGNQDGWRSNNVIYINLYNYNFLSGSKIWSNPDLIKIYNYLKKSGALLIFLLILIAEWQIGISP